MEDTKNAATDGNRWNHQSQEAFRELRIQKVWRKM